MDIIFSKVPGNKTVELAVFPPTKAKENRWLLDSGDFVFPPDFQAVRQAIVQLDANGWAADHRHQRQEVLLGITGDLYLIWCDSDGTRREHRMLRDDGRLQVFFIPAWVPHLVENRSAHAGAALYEWSDIVDEAELLEGPESLRP